MPLVSLAKQHKLLRMNLESKAVKILCVMVKNMCMLESLGRNSDLLLFDRHFLSKNS